MKKIISVIAILLVLILTVGSLAACSSLMPQSKQLVGKWESNGDIKGGFEFREDNTVEITVADLGISLNLFGTSLDGKVDGIYTTEKLDGKNIVTISYKLALSDQTLKYEYSVKDNVLTLTDPESGTQKMFIKASAESTNK